MRHIVCRFKDEAHFFRHLSRSALAGRHGPKDTIAFLGNFDAEAGTDVRLTIVVANRDERYDVTMKVHGRRPMRCHMPADVFSTPGVHETMWRYEAVVKAEDAVWLEMFASKLAMIQRIDRLAPPSTQANKKDQARVLRAA